MPISGENRVPSAKTSRGSQYPNGNAGQGAILQPAQVQAQHYTVTVEEVNRVLDVGKILRSVLTPEELVELHKALYGTGRTKRSR